MVRLRFPFSGRPIGNYLVAIALMTLVPSFVFAGVLMQRNHAAQEATLETLILATSRSLIQGVDREIGANMTTLRVLATSTALRSGNDREFHERSGLALEGTGAHLFVIDPDYMTLLSTRRPFDAEPVQTADPDSARRAFETNQIIVTDLLLGAVSNDWVYNILLPVDLGPRGRKIVALNQSAGNFDETLLANRLPEGWATALLDTNGLIIAATDGVGEVGERFTSFNAMALPVMTGWQRTSADVGPVQLVLQSSRLTGWRLVAWAPESVIAQPLFNAMMFLIGGGIILGGLILAGLIWVSQVIGSSVRGLARDARRLGNGEIVEAKEYPVQEIAEVSRALQVASERRQASDREVNFLMREVAHRSKNQMTVITAMAKQTARSATDLPGYVKGFEQRILGLASSTDLLMAHGREGVLLADLLQSQIAPFAPQDTARVRIAGPTVRLNAQAAQIMGMAAHELSTNAVKYGAFSGDEGRLSVQWTLVADRLDFIWRETVPARTESPDRIGFGTTVLKSMVGRALKAEVERVCHDDGIEWRFSIPLSSIDPAYYPEMDAEDAAE